MKALPSTASFVLVAAVLSLWGCVTHHGEFSVLSSKLVRTTDFEISKAERINDVQGRDVAHVVVCILTKANPTLEGAIDDALRKGQGDLITDAVVHYWHWYIPFIYGQIGWSVAGDVVKARRY